MHVSLNMIIFHAKFRFIFERFFFRASILSRPSLSFRCSFSTTADGALSTKRALLSFPCTFFTKPQCRKVHFKVLNQLININGFSSIDVEGSSFYKTLLAIDFMVYPINGFSFVIFTINCSKAVYASDGLPYTVSLMASYFYKRLFDGYLVFQ